MPILQEPFKNSGLQPEAFLLELFDVAVSSVKSPKNLQKVLPSLDSCEGRLVVVGAGKASAALALCVEEHYQGQVEGIVITPHGALTPCQKISLRQAAHPVPDEAGLQATAEILSLVRSLSEKDTLISLISGGGSSLLCAPRLGISLKEKQEINKALLRSGASISEMNTVRKHLSLVKGGQLADASKARIFTYLVSDVPGDQQNIIASGPTLADETTCAQAFSIVQRYGVSIPAQVEEAWQSQEWETPKSLKSNSVFTVATPLQGLEAAAQKAEDLGLPTVILSDRIEGEASSVAKVHSALALGVKEHALLGKAPLLILSGGETTVTLKKQSENSVKGRGGRNTEFSLALALELEGQENFYALACDTDGIDGTEKSAGAYLTPELLRKLNRKEAQDYLQRNDSYSFFKKYDALVTTGPTLTNINDFRAILILEDE